MPQVRQLRDSELRARQRRILDAWDKKPQPFVPPVVVAEPVEKPSLLGRAWDFANTSVVDKAYGVDETDYREFEEIEMKKSKTWLGKFLRSAAVRTAEVGSSFASPLNLALTGVGAVYGSAAKALSNLSKEKAVVVEILSKAKAGGNFKAAEEAAEQLTKIRRQIGLKTGQLETTKFVAQSASAGISSAGVINMASFLKKYKDATPDEQEGLINFVLSPEFEGVLGGAAQAVGGAAGVLAVRGIKPDITAAEVSRRQGELQASVAATKKAPPIKETLKAASKIVDKINKQQGPDVAVAAMDDLVKKFVKNAKKNAAAPANKQVETQTKLPRDLQGAKPRYNRGQDEYLLEFADDLDRAAYISAQSSLSKRDADFVKFVTESTGLSETQVRQYGRDIKAQIKAGTSTADPGVFYVEPFLKPRLLKQEPQTPTNPTLTESGSLFTKAQRADLERVQSNGPVEIKRYDMGGNLINQSDPASISLKDQRKNEAGFIRLGGEEVPETDPFIDFSGKETAPASRKTGHTLVDQWLDDLFPVQQVERLMKDSEFPTSESPYYAQRMLRGAGGKAKGFLEFGVRSADSGEVFAPSLKEVLKQVKDRRAFSNYVAAKKTLAGSENTIIPKSKAQGVVDKYVDQFDAPYSLFKEYEAGLRRYVKDSGMFTPDQVNSLWKAQNSIVPLQSVIEFNKYGEKLPAAQRVVDPLEVAIRDTFSLVDMVERNNALRKLVEPLKNAPPEILEKWIRPSQGPFPQTTERIGKLRAFLTESGINTKGIGRKQLNNLNMLFKPFEISNVGGKNYISVLENGKRKYFEVINEALYDAIVPHMDAPNYFKELFLQTPTKLLRSGATLSTSFVTRNPIRDTWTASFQSRYGFKPVLDTVRGFASMMKRDHYYQEFLDSGAGQSAMVSPDRNLLKAELRALHGNDLKHFVTSPIELLRGLSEAIKNMEAAPLKAGVKSAADSAIAPMQWLSEKSEYATRIGEFRRALDTEAPRVSREEALAKASMAARDVTIDFMRGGHRAKAYNRNVAFFNAMIQGNLRTAELFKQRPLASAARAGLAITTPTFAAWWLNKDNEVYNKKPQAEKFAAWHFPLNGWESFGENGVPAATEFVLIPKPAGAVTEAFGDGARLFLDWVYEKDPGAIKDMLEEIGDLETYTNMAVQTFMYSAVLPMLEVFQNYSYYRKRNLISPYDEGVEPELQVSKWTSETAKAVSRGLGGVLTPIEVDHLIYGYFAGLGQDFLNLPVVGPEALSRRLSENPPPEPPSSIVDSVSPISRETPFLGSMFRTGLDATSSTLDRFYRRFQQMEDVKRSITKATEAENYELADQLYAENEDLLLNERAMRLYKRSIDDAASNIRSIFTNTTMRPQTKQTEQQVQFRRMINAAAAALGEPELE